MPEWEFVVADHVDGRSIFKVDLARRERLKEPQVFVNDIQLVNRKDFKYAVHTVRMLTPVKAYEIKLPKTVWQMLLRKPATKKIIPARVVIRDV